MDFLSSSVDIAFILLTLVVMYNQPTSEYTASSSTLQDMKGDVPPPQTPNTPYPSSGYLSVSSQQPQPYGSNQLRFPNPGVNRLKNNGSNNNASQKHKKKQVSFSLSSINDLSLKVPSPSSPVPSTGFFNKKLNRPPTPFFKSLLSPLSPSTPRSPKLDLNSPLLPPSPSTPIIKVNNKVVFDFDAEEGQIDNKGNIDLSNELSDDKLDHGILQEDSMGIQKKWLVK
ncbi:uncharacterized protein L201_007897 [Kwoniella dendrophila CBS 6074]|uniref:Uncharacterized protein n=1 Tax=Kwoniella dendrophila CBS 6074 TaxID=1295534 RepID=A0AAX4K712_9TREE